MRLFVSEYLCSGAWPEPRLSHSLAREGRAMLLGMLADLSTLPDISLCTTWDARLGTFPFVRDATGSASASQSDALRKNALAQPVSPDVSTCGAPFNVECTIIDTAGDEAAVFQRLARECDATYVIAPELDDLLTQRVRLVFDVGGCSLNASPAAISAASDKWETFRRLKDAGIPTVPTARCDPDGTSLPSEFPVVVKPRFGAGAQDTFLIHDATQYSGQLSAISSQKNPNSKIQNPESTTSQFIVQPYIAGRSLSVAAIFGSDGTLCDVWPIGEQRLSTDGRFIYLGGTLPLPRSFEFETPVLQWSEFRSGISDLKSQISTVRFENRSAYGVSEFETRISDLITRVSRVIPGLRGYIGFDLIVPNDSSATPWIVDINPRLTTSYLGYRVLSNVNLAERLLWPDRDRPPVVWADTPVAFAADGAITRSSSSRG